MLKSMSTFFTEIQRMLYYLIRIINPVESRSRMTFLTSRVLATLFAETLGVRFVFDKKVSQKEVYCYYYCFDLNEIPKIVIVHFGLLFEILDSQCKLQ